ncbi:hypothetical protein CGRA01v4_07363 [Colletotrichum graminicola]|nr:hypothetical protein CGRA01v4_07363 [Colletotrichum graminicola]
MSTYSDRSRSIPGPDLTGPLILGSLLPTWRYTESQEAPQPQPRRAPNPEEMLADVREPEPVASAHSSRQPKSANLEPQASSQQPLLDRGHMKPSDCPIYPATKTLAFPPRALHPRAPAAVAAAAAAAAPATHQLPRWRHAVTLLVASFFPPPPIFLTDRFRLHFSPRAGKHRPSPIGPGDTASFSFIADCPAKCRPHVPRAHRPSSPYSGHKACRTPPPPPPPPPPRDRFPVSDLLTTIASVGGTLIPPIAVTASSQETTPFDSSAATSECQPDRVSAPSGRGQSLPPNRESTSRSQTDPPFS